MELNTELFKKFGNTDSKILAVTKYWSDEETQKLRTEILEKFPETCCGFGENRLETLNEKTLQREETHFIGTLQTKKLKYIIDHCEIIHSLDNIKHARKLNSLCESKNTWVKVFIQINIDPKKEGGVAPEKFAEFLTQLEELENLGILGISGMGSSEFTKEEKEKEFDTLIELKNKYLQNGLISAGTSLDYEIALEKGIDIMRIGNKLIK